MSGSPLRSESKRMIRNLQRLYLEQSIGADRITGKEWYPLAHRIVCDWADTFERSIANVACIVSALSPQLNWERNLIIADDLLRNESPSVGGALPVNIAKAQRVRDERLSNLLAVFPGGPKVNSFAANLAGDYAIVTVDAHALQAALADVTTIRTLKWSAYAVVSDAYIAAAAALKMAPAELQATIWVTWKRLHPAAQKRVTRRQWSGDLGEF